MKILFLPHYLPPEVNAPAIRTYGRCRRWVELGREVTVVSYMPHHPASEAYHGYCNKPIQTESNDSIKAVNVLTYITANKGFFKRTWNYVFYILMATIAPFLSRADVVISTSSQFFNGPAGYFISRLKRRPSVLEICDLWPASNLAVGGVMRAFEAIERLIYCKSGRIMPAIYEFQSHLAAHGGNYADQSMLTDRYEQLISITAITAKTGNSTQTPRSYHR